MIEMKRIILKHFRGILFSIGFCSIAFFVIYNNYLDYRYPLRNLDKEGIQKNIEVKNKIKLLANNLNTNEFKAGGLSNKDIKKYEWYRRISYIYLNECKTPQDIETALINSGFNDVWVAINQDIFSSTSCIGDVNFSIKAKPQGGKVCMQLYISDSWEKGRNADKPQCWGNSTQQIEETISVSDNQKLSSKNDESVEKYAEMENKIKSLAKSLSTNKFEYFGLYKLGQYEWRSNSTIYLNECLSSVNIQTALVNNGFKNISSTIGADSYNSTSCIGDVDFSIQSKAKNGKICGKVNVKYSWQKGRNLNNPQCWDIPKQSNQDNKQ